MAGRSLGSIEAPASMENWDKINEFISDLITKSIKDKSKGYKLRLASEELVSNIVRAASELKEKEGGEVSLCVAAWIEDDDGKSWFVIRTKDDGAHFDPRFGQRDKVNTEQHINEREIGGLGLFLIEQSVDKVAYDWIDGYNSYELWLENGAQEDI
jgi:serine/threonine-protein kinase RsbW